MARSMSDHVSEMLLATCRVFTKVQCRYRIHVVTGDRRGAGTDSNVFLVIYDQHGNPSQTIKSKTVFTNDHEKGRKTTVDVEDIGINSPFSTIEIWRDNFGNLPSVMGKVTEYFYGGASKRGSAAWFLDRVEIECIPRCTERKKSFAGILNVFSRVGRKSSLSQVPWLDSRSSSDSSLDGKTERYLFPVQRWIAAGKKYKIELYDTMLPRDELRPITRREELEDKKENYRYIQNVSDGPVQIASLPSDEKFSDEYFWTFATDKAALLLKTQFIKWTTRRWQSLRELRGVYSKSIGKPKCMDNWNEDWWFGLQRVQGVNPMILKSCKSIPEKLGVTEKTVTGLLGGLTLQEALSEKKLFICDLVILDDVKCLEGRVLSAPIALFFLHSPNELMPIAIQLQQKKGPSNPVFTPNDPPSTWQVAKMFYNNAEAQHHQGVTHLGLTHLLMEGLCICTHRNLSPSHPIFKLIAPHFLFLLAINSRGLEKLISPGGWVDTCMTVGVDGMFEVIKRGFDFYDFTKYGNVEKELKNRGVDDPEVLPYYPYRDDAIDLYKIIKDYVRKVVKHYYDSVEKMMEDWELKEWRIELGKPKDRGGVGLKGVPGDDTHGFRSVENLVETVTIIIATCSLGHSAANFQQYEQYAFVPNYPGLLMNNPPIEKVEYKEADILKLLPSMSKTLGIMVITKLLSNQGTNSIGNFEMQYLYDPIDVQAADEFRKDLRKLSLEIQKRNVDRRVKYDVLDPERVPNAISI